MAEALSVYRSKKTRPWVLNIHYPEKALWHRSLRRRGDIRPRFLRVGSIRMRSGGPDYGKVEVYLAKKPDGSCIHFCGDHCSIYARRPHACKAWFCGRGTDDETVWRQLCDEERDLWTPKQQFSELKLEMPDDEGPALRCDLPKRKALSQCD